MSLPSVPDSFYWTNECWGPALRCDALDPFAPHLFTTRALELASHTDWQSAAAAVAARCVVMPTQVHGRAVAVIRRGVALPSDPPQVDVIVSDHREAAIAVKSADCVPLLLADTQTATVAAVHAGWRGTVAGAAAVAIDAMRREFGVRPANVVAAIGPSIGRCCYQVGSELVDAFAAAGHARQLIDRWFVTTPPARGKRDHPELRLDLTAANRDQLILAGVEKARIYIAGLCTAAHPDVLTSYRAEKGRAGRLAGVIRARD